MESVSVRVAPAGAWGSTAVISVSLGCVVLGSSVRLPGQRGGPSVGGGTSTRSDVDVLILLLTSPWGPRASIRVPADERPRHPRNIPMAFVIAAPCIDHLDQAC